MDDRTLDRMRQALAACTFVPGSPPKRFARQVAAMRLEDISGAQRRHVVRLCWRYRRQMPRDLVPSKDAVEAMDAAWNAEQAQRRHAQAIAA